MIKAKFIGEEYKCDEFHVQTDDVIYMTDEKYNELKNTGEFELVEETDKNLPPVKRIGR